LLLIESHFKGWAKPGPIPPGATSPPAVPDDETLDAISGHFRLFQLRRGHRFSTDDVLTAWYGTTWVPSASTILDLGSGIGSVATIAAWRLPGARLVTIEAQPESVRLARKSAAYNGLTDRCDIRDADFRDPQALGQDERFDLVLGSPPYFPVGTGIEGDHDQKIACRFELRGDINDYARIAAKHLAAGGVFTCIFPEEQRERVEVAAKTADLLIVRRRPVVFREGQPPLVTLFAMTRSSEYAAVKLAIGFPPGAT
jgi:tRNA1(Val) A37 N6-methylase TrmN6